MIKPGQIVSITCIDAGQTTVHHNLKAVEYSDGLLKVISTGTGEETVYNLRSSAVVRVEIERQR